MLQAGRKLYPHHVDPSREHELNQVLGVVTTHPQDTRRLGLCNEGAEPWVLLRSDGSREEVTQGRNAPLQVGNKIQFLGGRTGRVLEAGGTD